MPGRNRFQDVIGRSTRVLKEASLPTSPCVFVSHRQADTNAARQIADFLINAVEIDVYIDIYDEFLSAATRSGDSERIVEYIEKGILSSTHLLGVFSRSTRGSWWVPFEIGSARQRGLSIGYLLLDGLGSDNIPEYLAMSKRIFSRSDLVIWAVEVSEPYNQKVRRKMIVEKEGMNGERVMLPDPLYPHITRLASLS